MHRYAFCIVALLMTAGLLVPSVFSRGTFYLKLDEFENYEGLLSSHFKCDNGRPCDPKFTINVKGAWGDDTKESDCFPDKNHILFGSTVGTVLPNPLAYAMEMASLPIHIDIRVKDCFLDEAGDDIAEFFRILSDLPPPFLYSQIIDAYSDSGRIRKLELSSLSPAPMSIKLRVSIWHRCDLNYFGQLCDKFCTARIPGFVCDPSGNLVCVSHGACGAAADPSSTTASTRAISTSTPSTTATPSLYSIIIKTSTPSSSTTKSSTTSRLISTSTVSMATKSPSVPKPTQHDYPSTTTASVPKTEKAKNLPSSSAADAALASDSGQSVLTSPLHLLLMLILGLILIVGITIVAVLCSRRRKVVRFNRDDIGLGAPLGTLSQQQQLQQQLSWTNQAYSLEQQSLQYRQSLQPLVLQDFQTLQQQQRQQDQPQRPDSGVYEEPIDISERNLPPLPPRTDLGTG